MAEPSKILEVKDLRISFRVDSGTVKAVRGISFDLYRGRTLCIVGESGSGKSVTSRAILGILAKNAIVEGGEIVYDGKDLLTINEDRFHKIRGSKISMIFQDPLSALNPIMRVGKQLTEPIFLKAKANKREATANYNAINRAFVEVGKAHNIPVNPELLKRLKEATLEELDRDTKKGDFERALAAYNRNKDIVDNPDQYPAKNIKIAKNYLQKHPEPTYQEPTLSKALTEAEEKALISMIYSLVGAANADYIESVRALHDKAVEVYAIFENDDVPAKETVMPACEALAKQSDHCKFVLRDDEDDIIGVFGTTLRKYLANMYKAVRREMEHEKKIAALAAKGQEEPPLTTKQRAKLPEKQLSSEEALEMLRPLFQTFIHHLNALIEQYFDLGEYSERFYRYYKNTLYLSNKKVSQNEAKEEALEIMRQVGIPQPEIRFYQYPFEFSGGMRQRIVIAIALSSRPEVLICDEPTTALDVTIQAQILELINKLKEELNLSIIFITHDLGVVANMADDIAVMYAGKIVEYGTVDDIFYDPRHPYTWALLASMPDLETKHKLDAIPGTPPNMVLPPIGDAFAARNKYALAIDFEEQPPLFQISETHAAATWLLAPDAPKATPPEIVRARIDRAMEKRNAAKRKEKA